MNKMPSMPPNAEASEPISEARIRRRCWCRRRLRRCCDLYSEPPHVGRGGWTWYTGSAGWMYRVALEGLLGFHLQGANLVLDPCLPRGWPGFEIVFRYRSARYEIAVKNPNSV